MGIHGANRAAQVDVIADEYGQGKAAPKFKAGDRVRLIKDGGSTTGATGKLATIEAWSDGKVCDRGEYLLNIDPPYNYQTLSVAPQYTRAKPDCFEPVLTIEEGKYYRTRDGRKVGPMERVSHSGQFRDASEAVTGYGWHRDGSYIEGVTGNIDLIAEWAEPAIDCKTLVDDISAYWKAAQFTIETKSAGTQLHVTKGALVKTTLGYGFELARYGNYVWVDTGKKAPICMRAATVTAA